MTRADLWHIRGGPKNGGRFGRLRGHRFEIGRNHKPMTQNARERAMRTRGAVGHRLGK